MFITKAINLERIIGILLVWDWEWAIKYPLPKFIPLPVGGLEIELRIV